MNRHTQSISSAKIARVADEMVEEELVQHETCFCAFVDYLKSLATLPEAAFGITDISQVVSAWQDHEDEVWHGGFIVDLRSGLRIYIESYEDERPEGPRLCARVRELEPHEGFEDFPESHKVKLYGWTKQPPELNELLSRATVGVTSGT